MLVNHTIDLTVILPAYLEEENLRILLPRLFKVLISLTSSFEIIVVDTVVSKDHTEDVCQENGVKYIHRQKSDVFGEAIRTGIAASSGKYIIFMDADGSHEPEFINNLWEYREKNDVVIASRYIAGGVTENSFALICMSKILNLIYALIFNLRCKDVSNSFKLYNGSQLRSLKLVCDNFDIVEEILIKLNKKYQPFQIKEIPFVFRQRMFGLTKRNLVLFVCTYFTSLIRLKWQTSRKERE